MWKDKTDDTDNGTRVLGNIRDFLGMMQKLKTKDSIEGEHIRSNIDDDIVEEKGFNDMPINNQLQILSYLDVGSLCRVAQVCSLWATLTEDCVLWDTKLRYESCEWQIVDHLSHPETYRRTCPDLSPKERYIKCCPEYRNHEENRVSSSSQLSKFRNYLGLSIPRVILFGSGLDTSGLGSRILMYERSPFTVTGAFPGQFDGIGSGVTLHYEYGTINLMALYGFPKAVREDGNIYKQSKWLIDDIESRDGKKTLLQPLKQLCSTVDSFVYVIDGSSEDKVTCRIEDFKAMIDDRWVKGNARILVLSLVPDATVACVPSLKVANKLDMLNLSRQWQVRQCHVDSLYGLASGIKWVTAHI